MARDAGSVAGQAWLRRAFGTHVPTAAVESRIVAGARRTVVREDQTTEFYPRAYAPAETVRGHLRFALRYEPLDMGVLAATMKAVDPEAIRQWVLSEPTGEYSRRAWFFHETFTGKALDLLNADMGNYVAALNPEKQLVARTRKSRRHRVDDNLLGGAGMCLTVRRTDRLAGQMKRRLDQDAAELVDACDPSLLHRALSYLYTKETRSSFAIEGREAERTQNGAFRCRTQGCADLRPGQQAGLPGPAAGNPGSTLRCDRLAAVPELCRRYRSRLPGKTCISCAPVPRTFRASWQAGCG